MDTSQTKGKPMEGNISIVGLGLSAIGPGIAIGLIFAALISGIARQPEASGALFGRAILGFVLAEALFIITLGISFAQ